MFWLVRHADTILSLTQRSRLDWSFRYLEHVRQANIKSSRGLWKKVSAQKMGFCQNIPTRFWASFFQNLNFFHFSWHKIWLVRRAVTIFLLTQRARLGGPFRYLEHVRKVHRKVSRGPWKKFQPKKWGFVKKWSSKSGWNILTTPHFLGWNFFFKGL